MFRQSIAALLILVCSGRTFGQASAPFPDALKSSNVRIEKTGKSPSMKMGSEGLLIGNGETNAIVYANGGDIFLRVSKNDVWDGRLDTSKDPALPVVDPANHKLTREKAGNPPSWNNPYPCGVPCADIKLAAGAPVTKWVAELDIATGTATLTSDQDKSVFRVLPGNVIYINSPRKVELMGVPQKFVPAAEVKTTAEGMSVLHQNLPGDEDTEGLDVYLLAKEEGERKAVAVTTSNQKHALENAGKLLSQTLGQSDTELVKRHQDAWGSFWSKSGVQLPDEHLQNWWYRTVYYFGCIAAEDATGVGLKSSFDGLAGWHNSYKFNYNIQQTYCAAGPINHPELSDPLIRVLENYWPRARWFAKNAFAGCEGAFVHSDVFHPHEPDPEKCKAKNNRQFAYIPWGYSLGMQGHISFILWESYLYRPDARRLEKRLYPMLRDIALFYCSFIEQCKLDDDGKYIIGPSYIPEVGYFGQDNTAYDIPFITYALKSAKQSATILKTDDALVRRIDSILGKMPVYPTTPDPQQENKPVVTYWRGAKLPNDDRHGSLVMAVFPGEQVNWFSPPQEKELFIRTIDLVGRITTHANSPVTLNIARARLGLTEDALKNIEIDFTKHHVEQPNGLFNWKAHGSYITEQAGVSRMISELLLQSTGGIVRIFPAWPKGKDAAFASLRAQGGFLISVKQSAGVMGEVMVVSAAGGELRIINPWPGSKLDVQTNGQAVPVSEANGICSIATRCGERYTLVPAKP